MSQMITFLNHNNTIHTVPAETAIITLDSTSLRISINGHNTAHGPYESYAQGKLALGLLTSKIANIDVTIF